MTRDRANFVSYLFILVTVAVSAYLYPSLPDPMPTHWNVQGEVDAWMPKPWGVIILPLATILVFVIMRLVPVLSPKRYRVGPYNKFLNVFQVAMVAFMSFVSIVVMLEAKGVDVHINQMVFAALGILFIITGSYFGALRKNFFLGIRTPWTLTNDEVWVRTHRLGGRLFILMGLIFLLGALYPVPPGWIIGTVFVLAFVPVVYSYFLYRRVENFGDEGGGDV
ncbi:MAG: SdpI family protein [Woeseia sp.]